MSIYDRPITNHGGAKYLRKIHPADGKGVPISVDVYCVIEAFGITCPALQHALKKILACGQRGKGNKLDDIHGILDAMWRARELHIQRESGKDHVEEKESEFQKPDYDNPVPVSIPARHDKHCPCGRCPL